MKEIEILYNLNENIVSAEEKILKNKFSFIKESHIIDTYFRSDLFNKLDIINGRLSASFRLREKGGDLFLTYKNDHFNDDEWLYSDEYETAVGSKDMILKILENINFKELVVVDNIKRIFKNDKYEIVLENVKNLGNFLEVELLQDSENVSVNEVKKEIRDLVNLMDIKIGEELNSGKPELLLKNNL